MVEVDTLHFEIWIVGMFSHKLVKKIKMRQRICFNYTPFLVKMTTCWPHVLRYSNIPLAYAMLNIKTQQYIMILILTQLHTLYTSIYTHTYTYYKIYIIMLRAYITVIYATLNIIKMYTILISILLKAIFKE